MRGKKKYVLFGINIIILITLGTIFRLFYESSKTKQECLCSISSTPRTVSENSTIVKIDDTKQM
jgi:hypothetical protein